VSKLYFRVLGTRHLVCREALGRIIFDLPNQPYFVFEQQREFIFLKANTHRVCSAQPNSHFPFVLVGAALLLICDLAFFRLSPDWVSSAFSTETQKMVCIKEAQLQNNTLIIYILSSKHHAHFVRRLLTSMVCSHAHSPTTSLANAQH
jgi:hypothetical protein